MPFKSKAQQKWMFATKPWMAKRWAIKTSNIGGLPKYRGSSKSGNKWSSKIKSSGGMSGMSM